MNDETLFELIFVICASPQEVYNRARLLSRQCHDRVA